LKCTRRKVDVRSAGDRRSPQADCLLAFVHAYVREIGIRAFALDHDLLNRVLYNLGWNRDGRDSQIRTRTAAVLSYLKCCSC